MPGENVTGRDKASEKGENATTWPQKHVLTSGSAEAPRGRNTAANGRHASVMAGLHAETCGDACVAASDGFEPFSLFV